MSGHFWILGSFKERGKKVSHKSSVALVAAERKYIYKRFTDHKTHNNVIDE